MHPHQQQRFDPITPPRRDDPRRRAAEEILHTPIATSSMRTTQQLFGDPSTSQQWSSAGHWQGKMLPPPQQATVGPYPPSTPPVVASRHDVISGAGVSVQSTPSRGRRPSLTYFKSSPTSPTRSEDESVSSSPSHTRTGSQPPGQTGSGDRQKRSNTTTGGTGGSTATFVKRLYSMLNDSSASQCSWNPSGTSFYVTTVSDFSRDVLPRYFKHQNFTSFVRQLNLYGFHKSNRTYRGSKSAQRNPQNEVWEFQHSRFMRDRPDLIETMKRNDHTREDPFMNGPQMEFSGRLLAMQESQTELMREVRSLRGNVADLSRTVAEVGVRQQELESIALRLVHSRTELEGRLDQAQRENVLAQQWQQNLRLSETSGQASTSAQHVGYDNSGLRRPFGMQSDEPRWDVGQHSPLSFYSGGPVSSTPLSVSFDRPAPQLLPAPTFSREAPQRTGSFPFPSSVPSGLSSEHSTLNAPAGTSGGAWAPGNAMASHSSYVAQSTGQPSILAHQRTSSLPSGTSYSQGYASELRKPQMFPLQADPSTQTPGSRAAGQHQGQQVAEGSSDDDDNEEEEEEEDDENEGEK
ncbi:hypothetical protein SAICODRAFT_22624 [Saitoella complicata NRRL Y-17804]|uniref:HSF-type DNA-binding domain-containing protein n=1 Tax=Saitoella complicata (strain BCRC 22490 / CBS 7301 / JCM 7358 / NBRC 10748 / NRRL Y-17804) TaxID=698492 RepID=A0A0E9NDI7_SAICN|nr:uncharacterized protein SAICODRAFT_22624 [Saitoella complicata NRRL Y-17804]ODQ56231.1 hypothetical protein SAICODRAFT_22624 [Saitoella complicata NRRL Y-17804]GAO47796.1 hypothetical protein G7K_1994-t1 [Saitoella complicata NRRL Y-17804]